MRLLHRLLLLKQRSAAASTGHLVTISGKVYGERENGDQIVVTVNGVDYPTTVNYNSTLKKYVFSVSVMSTELEADPTRTVTAVLRAHDLVKNVGIINGSTTY